MLRWADLIERHSGDLIIFHAMERWRGRELDVALSNSIGGSSAFMLAAADPIFVSAGLSGCTLREAMRFFELSQEELHEFSCDCGGHISNTDMAARVRRLAGPDLSYGLPPGALAVFAFMIASALSIGTVIALSV